MFKSGSGTGRGRACESSVRGSGTLAGWIVSQRAPPSRYMQHFSGFKRWDFGRPAFADRLLQERDMKAGFGDFSVAETLTQGVESGLVQE